MKNENQDKLIKKYSELHLLSKGAVLKKIITTTNGEYYFEIKSVKPNDKPFKELLKKHKFLREMYSNIEDYISNAEK